MEPLVRLSDGRIIAFGVDYPQGGSQRVNLLRIFEADGTEVTAQAVEFGLGTPVGDPSSDYDRFAVQELANGSIRVIATAGFEPIIHTFDLDSTGTVTGSTAIDPADYAAHYLAPYSGTTNWQDSLITLGDGSLALGTGQNLVLYGADGMYTANTSHGGPYESVSETELIQVGNRILRVSQVGNPDVEIRAQFYELDGSLSGSEIIVATGLDYVFGHWDVEVTELTDGRIAVAYASARDGDADNSESAVYVTVLNADGTVDLPEVLVNNQVVAGAQDWINLFAMRDGAFAVTYGSETGFTGTESINVQFFDAAGEAYDAFHQTGTPGRTNGEELHVSLDGVVTWMDVGTPQQLYDAPLPDDPGVTGAELLVSEGALGELAEEAETARLADGRVIVVYDNGNLTGVIRSFDPAAGIVSTLGTIPGAREMSVAALADGGFAVAWHAGTTPLNEQVHIQVFNADGSVRLADTVVHDGEAEYIQLHATQSGFMLAYVNDEAAFDDDGTVQFFGADGAPLGGPIEIDDGLKQEDDIDAALLSDGRLVVVWNSDNPSTFENSARYMIYASDGTPALAAPVTLQAPIGNWQALRVVALQDGGFAIVHVDENGVFRLNVLDAAGNPLVENVALESEQAVNPGDDLNLLSAHGQTFDIALTGEGQLVLAYVVNVGGAAETDVRYGIYELDGSTVIASQTANENIPDGQSEVELVALADGTVLLTFSDDTNVQFSSQQSIRGVIIQGGSAGPYPTEAADDLRGTPRDDIVDLLAGDDTFAALAGDDTVLGGSGDDNLDGGPGADVLDGGAGSDTADYISSAGSVFVDLINTGDNTGDAAGDSYVSIENIRGGLRADDLRGDHADNLINGSNGNDFILGRGGIDTLVGGNGDDTLSGMDGNDVLNGGADNDVVSGGQGNDRLLGGTGNDLLVGTAGNNSMIGGSGNDTMFDGRGDSVLFGGTGADRLIGGVGNDRLLGDFGNDNLAGNNGNDTLSGGAGNDYMVGGNGVDTFTFQPDMGADRIEDFELGLDRLFIASALTGGVTDAATVLASFADASGGSVFFDFGGGNTLDILNLTGTAGLELDMLIT